MEGAELEVLKTVDFSRLSVKVLMVELDGHNKEKDQAVTDLLAGAGFTPLKKTVKVGGWAVRRDLGLLFSDCLYLTAQLSAGVCSGASSLPTACDCSPRVVPLPCPQNDMTKLNTAFIHRDAWPHLAHAPNITEASM